MIDLITDNLEAIRDLCRAYGVRTMHVFGSAATGEFVPGKSDVDLIIQWIDDRSQPGFSVIDLAIELETLLGVHVDLLVVKNVTNPYLREAILEQRVKIYESPVSQAAA